MSKAQELYNKYIKAQEQVIACDNRINERLRKLCLNHPDASVSISTKGTIKASSITVMWEIIKDYDVMERIKYLQNIEDWIEEQNKYVQTKMF